MAVFKYKELGADGKWRQTLIDSENQFVGYAGYAKDFQDKMIEIIPAEDFEGSAQDMIDDCDI